MNQNKSIKSTFEKGYSKDLTNNVENSNTLFKGINGRLYTENGVLGYASIDGTKQVYENTKIVKYLGVHNFADQAIVFAKCVKPEISGEELQTETITEYSIVSEGFSIVVDIAVQAIPVSTQISDNSTFNTNTYTVTSQAVDPNDFNTNFSEVAQQISEIDFSQYYSERQNVSGYKICPVKLSEVPVNNKDFYDTIISFTISEQGLLKGIRIWTGMLNLPMNGKVTAEGVEENEFFKRVYFSDALNPRRVVNVKDPSLVNRKGKEFNQILENILLQPEIEGIFDGGQCKSMKVMYAHRIISENGQVSEFSPFSFFADVLPDDEKITFRGGGVSEGTTKYVKLKCNIINPNSFDQVECIAIEFEGMSIPTAIKNLGVKPAQSVVTFTHYGNEPEFSDNITIQDLLELKNTWLYCNDFSSKKNKLIAGGLRNKPVSGAISNMEYLFPLHSWKDDGTTFQSLINPRPWEYRYIDPTNTNALIYVKRKRYEGISSFGPTVVKLTNKSAGQSFEKNFNDLSLESYTDILPEVIDWLLHEQTTNVNFNVLFPNLKIEEHDGNLMFMLLDPALKTDLSNYIFESVNDQFIQDYKNDIAYLDNPVDTSKLIHGAQSIGFSTGTGVRITYTEVKEALLNQATGPYETGNILDMEKPSLRKYFMKGEIYRLAFQGYDKSSSRYFAINLGDVMIPEIGDAISYITDSGDPVITSKKYFNQSVENGVLYGHGIEMKIEVRLDCELQELISMYQILYVERTEENRTILCQGISAPLTRIQHNGMDYYDNMPEELTNKWNIPYYGGPVYEKIGLKSYDALGENKDYLDNGPEDRVMTNRRLMYFDSPDIYFGKISPSLVKTSKAQIIGKLNTDHTPKTVMNYGARHSHDTDPLEVYPKFSRKIRENHIDGQGNIEDLPRHTRTEDSANTEGNHEYYFFNVSVFASYGYHRQELGLSSAEELNDGETISGTAFNLDHDVSNNAPVLPVMPWYYGYRQRQWEYGDNRPKWLIFEHMISSPGRRTMILKTDTDLFTDEFIGTRELVVEPDIRDGLSYSNSTYAPRSDNKATVYDTYSLINIYRNNRDSVYGGRSEQAYSRNTYIPLSRTIPVSKNNGVQSFNVGGDTYVTLNIRVKNYKGDAELKEVKSNNNSNGVLEGAVITWIRPGAWAYVNVLETQVEPKLNPNYEFYRQAGKFNLEMERPETVNPAYLNVRNVKKFIPKPFKFKDDPDLQHIVAVSNVKLSGELYDAWTMFKPNNFYAELEKNKGVISNLFKFKDDVFAIQEKQISLLYLGADRIITDQQGNPINIKQGSGNAVEGHKVLAEYGTKIRRAVSVSPFGFSFFDEDKVEFIKNAEPCFVKHLLHLDYWNQMKTDHVIDTEAFYDHKHKETNIRIRTASGLSFVISYNEVMQVFNGEMQIDNDLYIEFADRVYAPVKQSPSLLHELNEGKPLILFGEEKDLTVGVITHAEIDQVLQYKRTGIITNIDYPVEKIVYKTSLGQERTILGTHRAYKMREGNHSVPAKNEIYTDAERADLRGNWTSAEITVKSKSERKVNILALINHIRLSHQ